MLSQLTGLNNTSANLSKYFYSETQLPLEVEPSIYIGQRANVIKLDRFEAIRYSKEASTVIKIVKDIALLERNIYIINPKDVKSYLWNNSFLLDYVFEGLGYVENIFGKGTEVHLELVRDDEEGHEILFLVVKCMGALNVVGLLNKLDEEWLLSVIDKLQGKFNITAEAL